MKKIVCCLGAMGLFAQVAFPVGTVALYTNAADGATVTLSSNVSVTNAPGSNIGGYVAGVIFNGGSGNGTLAGAGDLSIYNIADDVGGGAQALFAVNGDNIDFASYTGNLDVMNDRSVFTNTASTANARVYGYGIDSDITGNISGMIGVSATGGVATATDPSGQAWAGTMAIAIEGSVSGDVTGDLTADAVGGTANAPARADATASAYGVSGTVGGNLSGTIIATSAGGIARATVGTAYAYADTYAINGSVSSNITGTISAKATGGVAESTLSQSYADAEAYGISGTIKKMGGMLSATAFGGIARSYGVAYGDATAWAMDGTINGDVTGIIIASAIGGTAISTNAIADADANAAGVAGNVSGNVSGAIIVTANGGVANVTSLSPGTARAYGTAYAFRRKVTGDVSGTLSATAVGGTATSAYYAYAGAEAGGIQDVVTGDVSAVITVVAVGGNASGANYANSYATAYGINEEVIGDFSGAMTVIADGGNALSDLSATAGASAYGINGSFIGDFTGDMTVSTIGGAATANSAFAWANATGIYGNNVIISNFTGNILVTSVAGTESTGVSAAAAPLADAIAIAIAPPSPPSIVTNLASAFAKGIYADGFLYLNASTGSIHAVIAAPTGYSADDLKEGSTAYAIWSRDADDIVRLGNVDIIGDVDLGRGANEVYVFGTTRVQGDVSATEGQNNYSFEIYEDANNPLNSKLVVERLFAGTNSTLAAYAAAGQTAKNMIGNSYEVISGNEIDGTFVENAASLFDLAILQSATNVMITATGLKGQDVSGNSVARATVQSALFVIQDLSAHSGGIRSLLRGEGAAPEGPAGPEAEKLADGEWAVYARQFNDLGSQDSEGALAGYDWQTSGFMLGAERLLNPNLVLGAAAGGAWTDLDGKTGAGGASEQFISSLYLNYFDETRYMEAGLFYSRADNDAQRIATDLQRYMGSYDSTLYGIWLEYGQTLSGKNNNLEPYVRTSYVSGNHDGYTDAGGTNPLTVDDNGTDNWLIEAGLRDRRSWELENGMVCGLELKAAWQHELLDNAVKANATLLNVGQTPTSPEADRDALALGIKADLKTSDAVTIGLEYAPTIAGNWYNHSINATLKIEF